MYKLAYPENACLLLAVPLLAAAMLYWRHWRTVQLNKFGPATSAALAISGRRFVLKAGLSVAALLCLTLAWMDPQQAGDIQSTQQETSDVFIALDISQSMLCQDIAPSRLEMAKIFTQKLVKSLEGERIGLIFFAGNAFLQMPLSTDYAFILQSIQSATPDMVSEQGTNIGAAITIAQQSFETEPAGGRMIIVISDGEAHDDEAFEQAETAFDQGTLVYAVGAGTAAGGPIPAGDGQYKRDEQNTLVRTRLDEAALRKLALSGGGNAYQISQGEAAIRQLTQAAGSLQKRVVAVRSFADFATRYQWFLFPALLLLLIELFVPMTQKKAA